ncbi:hypothetical protein Ocin01_16259 [Orchesella cincta]|uniref:Death domain-containing protein n=1 Tax=Orchesella cincta TaxID=48709 RepID=A0A1D2MC10_ORCCI|nr:hypothetical protein Ocin01_16259 [Orchesella cincta]
MENTTVESFHYRFIYEAIQGASVYHGSKWEDIAIRLISYSKINEITERNLSTDVRKKYYETFEAWRHSKGETATLGKLIEVLEIEKLPIAAQNIRDKYGITRSTSRPAGLEFGYRRFNSVVKQT